MSEINLFYIASRSKFRFPSTKGDLTVEQLWEMPLTSRNGFSVNDVAIRVNSELKSLEEESFVETSSNPRRTELRQMLDLIKIIIATRKQENEEATEAARKASLRKQIMDTIATKEKDQLSTMSIDELRELAKTL